jgi:hypothetical protein
MHQYRPQPYDYAVEEETPQLCALTSFIFILWFSPQWDGAKLPRLGSVQREHISRYRGKHLYFCSGFALFAALLTVNDRAPCVGLLKCLQANAFIMPPEAQNHFLSNPSHSQFLIIFYSCPTQYELLSSNSVIKQPKNRLVYRMNHMWVIKFSYVGLDRARRFVHCKPHAVLKFCSWPKYRE